MRECFGHRVVNRKCGPTSSHIGSMWNNAFRRHAEKRSPATWFRIVWIQSNRWIGRFVCEIAVTRNCTRALRFWVSRRIFDSVAELRWIYPDVDAGITAAAITRSRNFKNPISQQLFRGLTENEYLIEFDLATKTAIKRTEKNMRAKSTSDWSKNSYIQNFAII